ncbi:MAG: hypothetical protein JO086_03595 [Acidimicrobiia bacterium]|nr:hypothetical protein [Acidimicrobiia bacterium]
MGPADVTVREFRHGGRNFIRVGDVVHVRPKKPGGRDGFNGRVRRIVAARDTGAVKEVDLVVLDGRHQGALRVLRPDRLERRAQTRNGERVGVRAGQSVADAS